MIKAEVENIEETGEPLDFPCLMIAGDGDILLVKEVSEHGDLIGTIIYSKENKFKGIGTYSTVWGRGFFTKFRGKLILQNKE